MQANESPTSKSANCNKAYTGNGSFVRLYDAESRYVTTETMCREALFLIDEDLFYDLPESWPLFAGQYEHLSAVIKDCIEDIHRYAIQKTDQVSEWIIEWLEQRREVNEDKAREESIYRPSYEVTVKSLENGITRLKNRRGILKILQLPYLPPIKMNASETKPKTYNPQDKGNISNSSPKIAKAAFETKSPTQTPKPAPSASNKSTPTQSEYSRLEYQNPYSLEQDYYTPKKLYDRIQNLETVISTCKACVEVEARLPIVKPTCLPRKQKKQIPATTTQIDIQQQYPFSIPKSLPLLSDKRTTHIVRLKEKLMKDKIFSYHNSPKFQDVLSAGQNMSMCNWNLLRFVCMIDMTIHDELAVQGKEFEHHYDEINAMLISQLRNFESKIKDDIEYVFTNAKNWGEKKISKLKAEIDQTDANKKSQDAITGMSMYIAKSLTEALNHIKTSYATSFDFKTLNYSLTDSELVKSVTSDNTVHHDSGIAISRA